jgi:hypothetical protein
MCHTLCITFTYLSEVSPDGSDEVIVDQEYGPEHSSDAEVNFLPFYDDEGFHEEDDEGEAFDDGSRLADERLAAKPTITGGP